MTHARRKVIQHTPDHSYTHSDSLLNSSVETISLRGRKHMEITAIRLRLRFLWLRATNLLHLKDEFAIFEVSVLWNEGSGGIVKSMGALRPSILVYVIAIKVFFETQLELVFSCFNVLSQVVIGLDVFISCVPGHAASVFEVISCPVRRPE